jgi:vacuolar-type H+-ATPase subunit E/Vma4
MTYDTLIKTMEASAHEKIHDLIAAAQQDAEEITSEANAQAERMIRTHLDAARKSAAIEKNKKLYAQKEEVKAALIRQKEAIYEAAFEEAGKKLNGIRNNHAYPALFEKLLDEALLEIEPQELRFHIDKPDEALCTRLIQDRHLKGPIFTDIATSGGLVVATADEQIVIFNTIESRLEKAHERLKKEIYSVLYGE